MKKVRKRRNQKKAKKKDKKEERKKRTREREIDREREREIERDREREIEHVGGQKRLRRNKGRHSKINNKCPSWGKTVFFQLEAKKEKQKKQKKTQKYQQWAFQLSVIFFFSLVGVQHFPFLTTWPTKGAPQEHSKIGVSAQHFLKNRCVSWNGHFRTRKPKPEIPVIFLCLPILFSTRKQKLAETPTFIVFEQT